MDAEMIVFEEPDQVVARCGPVLVWASRHKLEDAPLLRLRDALEQHAREHPQGVALLMVAVGDDELPKPSTRRWIVRGLSTLGDRLQAVAAVFEGDTPWLALARSAFDAILVQLEVATSGGPQFPIRAFADRLDAVVWLGGVVVGGDQRPIETDALTELVEFACDRITPA
jgi:hypothetical protein